MGAAGEAVAALPPGEAAEGGGATAADGAADEG